MSARAIDPQAGVAGAQPRPAELADFRGCHAGESILVCGCGSSLSQIVAPERVVTIGVNDVGRLFDPDYLVVLNPRRQFAPGRFQYVENSRARVIFTQLDLGIGHSRQVRVRLAGRGQADLGNPNALPYTRNSPYPAVCLAAHMGARRIGLIGVDFTDHHFFGATGRHALANEFEQIDREYRQLYESCTQRGIELVNLSRESRLTGIPKISAAEFLLRAHTPGGFAGRRVFFVNYRFLSCGTVFRDGLAHAAEALGLTWEQADWDDPRLDEKIAAFQPEAVLVVHGRKFASRRQALARRYRTGVWLLDEPYEVDDTSRFSGIFESVFLNDPGTLHRHRNAHYLPVCYDPAVHTYSPPAERPYAVGFIGGKNPRREEALGRLARRGLLSYVVGGPWRDPALQALCLSANIPAEETAALYRRTRIVVNLFRSRHHYNTSGIPAVSLNPRIYEALACGALVISERRSELETVCPELPAFDTLEEMEFQIERHLQDEALYAAVRKASIRRLASHTYAKRLEEALPVMLGEAKTAAPAVPGPSVAAPAAALPPGWRAHTECVRAESAAVIAVERAPSCDPGGERGLVGIERHGNVTLEFDLNLQSDTEFLAKIHQADPDNQLADSYHLFARGSRAYLARHNRILHRLELPVNCWVLLTLAWHDGILLVRKNGAEAARVSDSHLESGYCFLGVKGGSARLRNISVFEKVRQETARRRAAPEYEVLFGGAQTNAPAVSIITTVYDRLDCLERCLQSTAALTFQNYEQIVVADAPPAPVCERYESLGGRWHSRDGRLTFAVLRSRHNDWGIAPAAAGLDLARGRYVCFLSDDNGYLPWHFDRLLEAVETDGSLGFAYTSCLYDGRTTLNASPPRPGRIDLGQPLFRRELFDQHLGGTLPFHEFGWDWRMIECFLRKGVRWRHINDATFIFRLSKYPHLMAPA
jgi:hypothetical protein